MDQGTYRMYAGEHDWRFEELDPELVRETKEILKRKMDEWVDAVEMMITDAEFEAAWNIARDEITVYPPTMSTYDPNIHIIMPNLPFNDDIICAVELIRSGKAVVNWDDYSYKLTENGVYTVTNAWIIEELTGIKGHCFFYGGNFSNKLFSAAIGIRIKNSYEATHGIIPFDEICKLTAISFIKDSEPKNVIRRNKDGKGKNDRNH